MKDNLRFLREKEEAARTLRRTEFARIAARAKEERNAPPSPEEIARLYEDLGEPADGFASFCLAFSADYRPLLHTVFTEGDGGIEEDARVAYLQNAYSDRAYRRFSPLFRRVAATYYPGFREVCEEVYSGRATHAILPLSNSADGVLLSFRRLIARYDLRITAACDIAVPDENTMRFALVRRGLPGNARLPDFLDLSVVPDTIMTPGVFLSSCELLGAKPLSVVSRPLDSDEDRDALDIHLDMRGADTAALYLFLEGSHVRYETVGYYNMV